MMSAEQAVGESEGQGVDKGYSQKATEPGRGTDMGIGQLGGLVTCGTCESDSRGTWCCLHRAGA